MNTVCPHCGSFAIEKICEIQESTRHYGRLVCSDCSRWIGWIPKPEKVTAQLQGNNFICPTCDSLHLVEEIHPEQTHYGRLVCGDCGRFIKWLPRPKRPKPIPIYTQSDFDRQYGWVTEWDCYFIGDSDTDIS